MPKVGRGHSFEGRHSFLRLWYKLYTCDNDLFVFTTGGYPSCSQAGYEKFTLVLETDCIKQSTCPSSSYNHNTLTTPRTSVRELLTLRTRSANILAHGLYTHSAMRQYIGAGEFTR